MDVVSRLEDRIRSLEASRGRNRLAASVFGFGLLLVSAVAMVPQTAQEAQEAQTVQELTAHRIMLSGETDQTSIVLRAGPQSSLLIQTADGQEIARIGGPAGRHTR